jgi:hypothetical protein
VKIKTTQRFILEDFPEQKDWIGKLFYVLNKFIADVILSINGGLQFSDNIMGMDHLLQFTFVSNAASYPLTFKWDLANPPKALSVVSAMESTPTTVAVPVVVAAAWTHRADGLIAITDIAKINSGSATVGTLTAKKQYQIRVRVTP